MTEAGETGEITLIRAMTLHLYEHGDLNFCRWDCQETVRDVLSEFTAREKPEDSAPPTVDIRIGLAGGKNWYGWSDTQSEKVARTLQRRWVFTPRETVAEGL